MAVRVTERPRQAGTMEYRRPTALRDYVISGTTEKIVAQLALLAATPSFDLGVDLQTGGPVQIFRNKLDMKECGGGVWEATIRYESTPDTVDLTINFATTTKKLFQAYKQRRTYDCVAGLTLVPGDDYSISNVPDFGTQINVTDDGVEGVDIEVGAAELTITKKWKRAALNVDYLQTLLEFNSRTPINHDTFTYLWLGQTLSFVKGCLRLRSATVQSNTDEELNIAYHLVYAKPITTDDDFTVGDSPQITAEGWDYTWTWYKKQTVDGKVKTTPIGVIVNQVYPYKDFNLLALDA